MNRKKVVIITIIACLFLIFGGIASVYAYNDYTVKQNIELGNKYLSDGQYEQAILAFNKVISINPSNVEARLGLSKAYVAIDKVNLAEEVLLKGIKLKPYDSRLYIALANIYSKEDKIQDEINILEKGYKVTKSKSIKEKLEEISSEITLSSDNLTLEVDKNIPLKLYYTNSDGEKIGITGIWSCNTELGSLNSTKGSSNVFNAKSEGSEIITVKMGSIQKTITITIKQHILNSLEITADKESTTVGSVINLKVNGKDQSGHDMDINPTWSINNNVGILSNTQGTTNSMKCLNNGTTIITVSQDNIKSTNTIVVDKQKHKVVVAVSGNGNVNSSPNSSEYIDGEKVKYTAVPASGWSFQGWQGSVTGSSNPIMVNINSNKRIVAVFVQNPQPIAQPIAQPIVKPVVKPVVQPAAQPTYILNVKAVGEGTAVRNNTNSQYTKGSTVTLTAQPEDGWIFDHWEGDASGNTNPLQLTMDRTKNITAVFIQTGNITGSVLDGQTANPISGAVINVRSGANTHKGTIVQAVNADSNGNYIVQNLKPGAYTLEISAANYNTDYFNVNCISGQNVNAGNNSLMPIENNDNIRINLTWNDTPSDLDSHLTTPDGNEVYYVNKDDGKSSKLDVDVTTGYGPENITIYKEEPGDYLYRVYNFSNDAPINTSDAVIKVYRENKLLKTYNISNANGEGRYWNVFKLNGDTITDINTISDDDN